MAPQPGGSAFPDTAAVPVADGRADDHAEKVRQTGGAAGIYGMILCKTEKFSSGFRRPQTACPGDMETVLYTPWQDPGRHNGAWCFRAGFRRAYGMRRGIRRMIHRHYDERRPRPDSTKSRFSGIIKTSSTGRRRNGFPVYGRKTEQP